jgi:hypothetical protein
MLPILPVVSKNPQISSAIDMYFWIGLLDVAMLVLIVCFILKIKDNLK